MALNLSALILAKMPIIRKALSTLGLRVNMIKKTSLLNSYGITFAIKRKYTVGVNSKALRLRIESDTSKKSDICYK